MITETLQRHLDGKRRRITVIIGTLVVGLAVGLPAADEYFALRDRCDRLSRNLQTNREAVAQLAKVEQTANKKQAALAEFEAKLADDKGLNDFRSWVIDQVREAGCQMRKVRAGTAASRRWREDANPLEVGTNEGSETPFALKTVGFSISASGQLANVKDLLLRLNKANKLIHAKRFVLRPEATGGRELVLELDWLLFDLQEAESKTTT